MGPTNKFYWRFDEAAPAIESGVTLQLPSIPAKHRLPESVWSNVTYYAQHVVRPPLKDPLFFEYNPSIVRLPPDQRVLQDAVYLASFRVSNQHYCLHPSDRKRLSTASMRAINYLGLALLDSNLTMLSNQVVDVRRHFQSVEDFRLFSLNHQLYLSSLDELVPLWLLGAPNGTTRVAPVVFGGTSASWQVSLGHHALCAPCSKARGACGKNVQYFVSDRQMWVEVWPSAPHQVRRLPEHRCRRSDTPESFVVTDVEFQPAPAIEGLPSLTRGRGGACCMDLEYEGQNLKVGVAHVKSKRDNHYLSNWYAFRAEPPFGLVAQSGYFCLGFGDDDRTGLTQITTWRTLVLGEIRVPTCPRIHFVSGLLREGDSVIVTYGINDCVSRFVRVPLSEVVRLLFSSESERGM